MKRFNLLIIIALVVLHFSTNTYAADANSQNVIHQNNDTCAGSLTPSQIKSQIIEMYRNEARSESFDFAGATQKIAKAMHVRSSTVALIVERWENALIEQPEISSQIVETYKKEARSENFNPTEAIQKIAKAMHVQSSTVARVLEEWDRTTQRPY